MITFSIRYLIVMKKFFYFKNKKEECILKCTQIDHMFILLFQLLYKVSVVHCSTNNRFSKSLLPTSKIKNCHFSISPSFEEVFKSIRYHFQKQKVLDPSNHLPWPFILKQISPNPAHNFSLNNISLNEPCRQPTKLANTIKYY